MMPFSIVRIWILGLLALAVVITAGYLAWDWYRYGREDEQLWWAIGLGTFALAGRLLWIPIMGIGPSPPKLTPVDSKRIARPDGTQIQVHVLRSGSGPVGILTHGWSINSSIWSYTEGELPANCEILAWDLRGLGASSKSPVNDYSIDAMAGDLLAVVKLAGDRPVILVGHSIGGMICQAFCRLFPQQLGRSVAGLILCGTTYTNPVNTALFAPLWRALQKPVLEPLLHLTVWLSPVVWLMNIQSYSNGTTQLTTRITSFAGRQTRGQVDLAARLSSFASPAVVARGMLAMFRFDEADNLANIDIPTEVIVGANDRLTKREAGEFIANHIPGAKLSLLTPAGHLSILERHETVNGVISKALANAAQLERQAKRSSA